MAAPAGQYVDTVTVEDGTGVVTAVMQAAGVVGADIAGRRYASRRLLGGRHLAGKAFNW
jgi:hypothetical protein